MHVLQINEVEKEIKLLNGVAEIKITSYSQIDPSWVLDINGYSSRILTQQLFDHYNDHGNQVSEEVTVNNDSIFCMPVSLNPSKKKLKPFPANTTTLSSSDNKKNQTSGMGTISLLVKGRMNLDLLNRFLDSTLYANGNLYSNAAIASQRDQRLHQQESVQSSPSDNPSQPTHSSSSSSNSSSSTTMRIYRLKGAVCVQDASHWYLLQGVHDIFEITPSNLPLSDHGSGDVNNSTVSKREDVAVGAEFKNVSGATFVDEGKESECVSKFIVIGRNLDNNFLYDGLCQCLFKG